MAMKRFPSLGLPFLLLGLVFTLGTPSEGAELTAFLSGARPGDNWGGGGGAALAITLFDLGGVEIEGAKQGAEIAEASLLTLSGRLFLSPPTGRLVPYGGVAAAVYRETYGSGDDWGAATGVFVGLKLKLGLAVRLRAEYQWMKLQDEAPLALDGRYLAGVGVSF
jgi:hypothetical protein